MNPGKSHRLSRAAAFSIALSLLVLVAGAALARGAALRPLSRPWNAPGKPVGGQRPIGNERIENLPLQRISLEEAEYRIRREQAKFNGQTGVLNAAPPPTVPQFTDLTTNPRPPIIGPSTKSQEIHPAWSWDQRVIYFASNNVDPVDNYGASTPPSGSRFHIYRMTSDGTFLQKVTDIGIPDEATGSQIYPALSRSQTKLAYAHRPNAATPYQLYVLDLLTGQREQITNVPGGVIGNPLNNQIVNVERPTWSPGDDAIAFSARNKDAVGEPRNIYVVDVVSKRVRRVTNGSAGNGVECIDPVYHPVLQGQSARILFAANTGNPALGPAVDPASGDLFYNRNPLQDLDGDGNATEIDHNLFLVNSLGPSAGAPIQQITFDIADDVEPAYQQAAAGGSFNNWIAFASRGRRPTPTAPRGPTYDIFIGSGVPETSESPIRLFSPDSNEGAVPLDQSDERYPTWSAGLPPQNPIDRIAFSSNRQQNVNNPRRPTVSATDTDIWAAEVTDITPPTLFSIGDDERSYIRSGVDPGEVLHIANAPLPGRGRRVGVAGDTFYFYAKVQDLQYGVESVWVQIKDPDGPSTDFQGINRKLYGIGNFPTDTFNPFFPELQNAYGIRFRDLNGVPVPTHHLHIPWETDFAAINATTGAYVNGQLRWDYAMATGDGVGHNSRFPTLEAGVDDSVRWSGNQTSPFWSQPGGAPWSPTPISNRPPVDGSGNPIWLQLRDDGVFPDQVRNDGIYSASWMSPAVPSDFYVDLIAYDKAFNPRVPTQRFNWIIYDNIWGFSTQPFVSRNPVLYVDDNGAGQKWPRGLQGSFRAFNTFRYSHESEVTDRPAAFRPSEVVPSLYTDPNRRDAPYFLLPANDPGASAFVANEAFPFLNGSSQPYTHISWFTDTFRGTLRAYRYDIWRILAKGPLPDAVINTYSPTVDRQPGDITGDPAQQVSRIVPKRAVVWNAPYMGDIYLGYGSILDQATQAQLIRFRARGGRLLVAGGDILWALTVNGTVPQQFVQNVLGANFGGDEDPAQQGNAVPFTGNLAGLGGDITQDATSPGFRNFSPGGSPPYWGPFFDPENIGTPTSWAWTFPNPATSGNDAPVIIASDGVPFRTQDIVEARPGWEQIYQNRMIATEDAATQSKTVFYSFSIASLGRRYVSEDDNTADDALTPLHVMNYKAKIAHATLCWMFSVDLTGQIRNINGGGPVVGAWVRCLRGGQVVGSAFTNTDGVYNIRGLPVGGWNIVVDSPGFLSFQKGDGNGAHGLDLVTTDIFLTPAPPGSISGRVQDTFGNPLPGARVRASLLAPPLYTGVREFEAVSGIDGTYNIPSVPVGTYDVAVVPPFPTRFSNPQPEKQTVATLPAQETPNVDFTLTGEPGPLAVSVFALRDDDTRGGPLADAEVTLQDASGVPLPGFSGTTDANGLVNFTDVPAGRVRVSAFKFGFQEGTAQVNIPQQDSVELLLPTAPARDIYGTAVRQIDGQPLNASDLVPAVRLNLLRAVSRLPTPRVATVFAPPSDSPRRHNYRFTAQQGEFIVALRDHARFFDAEVLVNVTGNGDTTAADLALQGRPGTVFGTVREERDGAPGGALADATVEIVSNVLNPGQVVVSLRTDNAGRWTTAPQQLVSDLYTINVRKFGFSSRTLTNVFVAGDTNAGQVLLPRGPRGRLYGTVIRDADDTLRAGVKVEFWTAAGSVFGQFKVTETMSFLPATPGPDGQPHNYSAGAITATSEFLPEGNYEVRVDDPRFRPVRLAAQVVGGQARRLDIRVVPLAGVLSGLVREDLGNGNAGPPISGATVRVLRGTTLVATLTTNNAGEYQTANALAPTVHALTASAFGFFDRTVNVFIEGPTRAPDILLRRVPPTQVRGTVRSSLDNALIEGATVELLAPDGSGPVLGSASSTATATGTPPANYVVGSVNAGNYLIRARKSGWKSAQRTITVLPGQALNDIHLRLDPSHVFGSGLLLISLPQDFPGSDAAALLDQPPATFKSAYWVTAANRYAIYPEAQAREFRLGKGMFVRLPRPVAFTRSGTPPPAGDVAIPVRAGWNLIGSVRDVRVPWLQVRVRTADNRVRTMQQAMDDGIVQNGLFGFEDRYFRSDYMQPFSGYFMRAFQDCTLLVPNPNGVVSAGSASQMALRASPAGQQLPRRPGPGALPVGMLPARPAPPRRAVEARRPLPGGPLPPRALAPPGNPFVARSPGRAGDARHDG